MQAVGVFWATVLSSSAFVLPRLMEVKELRREVTRQSFHGSVHVSGLDLSTFDQYTRSVAQPDDSTSSAEKHNKERKLDTAGGDGNAGDGPKPTEVTADGSYSADDVENGGDHGDRR